MIKNPYSVVQQFEEEVAAYCAAPYAVSVDSCTNALFLCLRYHWSNRANAVCYPVTIPSKTYLSVPMTILHSGFEVSFDPERNDWAGIYQLFPYNIWDAAKRFTKDMFIDCPSYGEKLFMCLSFHVKKHLKIGKGGMILTNDAEAVKWFKKARYEGRSEKLYHEDDIGMLGWNMYMTIDQAARGLMLLHQMPQYNPDLGEPGGYRDLREFTVFKNIPVV